MASETRQAAWLIERGGPNDDGGPHRWWRDKTQPGAGRWGAWDWTTIAAEATRFNDRQSAERRIWELSDDDGSEPFGYATEHLFFGPEEADACPYCDGPLNPTDSGRLVCVCGGTSRPEVTP